NQLRTPLLRVPAVMPPMRTVPRSVPTAPAIKPSPPAVASAIAPAVRTSTAVPSTESSAIAPAALWSLEARTWIGPNAREILARRSRSTRRARLPRQQDHVFFGAGLSHYSFAACGNGFRFHVLERLFVSEIGAFCLAQFGVLQLMSFFLFVGMLRKTSLSDELCLGFVLLHNMFFLDFVVSVLVLDVLVALVRLVQIFRFILVEIGAAHQ